MPSNEELFHAAERLRAFLIRHHLVDGALRGPDSGVRFNLRLWRFLKSALDFVPWRDDYLFMQTQGYWVLANWMMYDKTGEPRYRDFAVASTEVIRGLQNPQGFWSYPLPERKHLVATVEGNWGAVGLLATYAREPRHELLQAAIRWHDFLVTHIGFQAHSRGKAINYFDQPRGKVPNNSVETAWFLLRLWKATGEERYLEHVDALLEFVAAVQLPSGELPYVVESLYEPGRQHYLCFQYNAFEFLKLAWSRALKPSSVADSVLLRLAGFLKKGVRSSGAGAADCSSADRRGPEIDYYTAALGGALWEAARLGLVETTELSDRCYARVLARQRLDSSFGFSAGDFGFLCDQRSYPRAQVMILFHLLYPCCGSGFPAGGA
jgi:hypothetical protein